MDTTHSAIDALHEDGLRGGGGFLLSLAPPAIIAGSALAGRAGLADGFAFLPLAVAFLAVPLLTLACAGWREVPAGTPRGALGRAGCRVLLLGALPMQLLALSLAAAFWSDPALSLAGRIGWVLSVGVFGALFGVTVAHELIHRRGPLDRAFGGILLSTVCFGSFKIVHPRVHHRFVGTPRDFASAPRGEALYRFWLRCLIANPREALRCERDRLAGQGRGWWRSELLVWYGLSLLWLAVAAAAWGWSGGVFFLAQSLVAILSLDWTNYVQHYGLRRCADATGRVEKVQPHHAWSMRCRISNLALLNLLRHGDHHAHPLTPYHALAPAAAPAYPYPFGFMMLLALVPPLFRRVVHPLLDRLPAMAEG